MRFGRLRAWLLLGVLALAAGRAVAPRLQPADEEPVQPETRGKAPLGKLLAGAMAVLVLAGGWFGYQGWAAARENEAVARAITGGDPARAEAAMTRYGCGGCHTIPGLAGADGQVAAPLAGLRQRVFVGGVLRNTAENLVGWIVQPQAYSPHSAMPATGISEAEARDVAAYLYSH